ncbi:uncharacterized protein L3040_008543 [Drepanopeziza brunnea f. sp. 'multigermtubi']|uniref:Uncharacterized protein n=1 Tax=Marssonina brunnea f. sp. multigermtubi (strain MB_m1) TaxID=1072389 RepID=K1X709_MARBU|nr:uncharacterized protein MBM_05737 [Drepanopeziza brunnea f. sp. 'multigermtubi' MB_m1]EKD16443.1 hypothetical protein MBM_05737 [Drepanopeziza brunnea f. sp. 'multigermtubi' MB_m1]KAJ5033427.1 hypothetical protein L3040_008543 [Drepanopeziza brunnea f. sp. 'multigermtubi']
MAILGGPDGMIEVRLVKLPFDAAARVYFDEYEKLGDPYPPNPCYECTRFIAPENGPYGIEITLKKGLKINKYRWLGLNIFDRARNALVAVEHIRKKAPSLSKFLNKDQVHLITTFGKVVLSGTVLKDASLSLEGLVPDENLAKETDVQGIDVSKLGGIQVQVYLATKANMSTYSEQTYQAKVAKHNARFTSQASKVDAKSFEKDGITHKIGVTGGVPTGAPNFPERTMMQYGQVSTKHKFNFLCRSRDFIENKAGLFKDHVPLELQPWDLLKISDRAACFRKLQNHDKDRFWKMKVIDAGSEADSQSIYKNLFKEGILPIHWRVWSAYGKRERELVFQMLQDRRKFFDKGEYPPEPGAVNVAPEAAKAQAAPIKAEPIIEETIVAEPAATQSPIAEPIVTTAIKNEPEEASSTRKAQTPPPEVIITDDTPPRHDNQLAPATTTVIKNEPEEAQTPSKPKARKPQAEAIIIIDDTPPRHNLRPAAAPVPAPKLTIKSEEIDSTTALQPSPQAKRPSTKPDSPTPAKRAKVKVEPDANVVTITDDHNDDDDDDDAVAELEAHEEQIRQEILHAERLAELMRERREVRQSLAARRGGRGGGVSKRALI